MIRIIRTDSQNTDFSELAAELDADLRIRDGDDHEFYAALHKAAVLNHTIVAYDGDIAVGCGAIRPHDEKTMEIKRMYVRPDHRKKGIASTVLKNLEQWITELDYKKCILETGRNQPEAIAMYRKNNYTQIPNYGKYEGMYNSVCFEKEL